MNNYLMPSKKEQKVMLDWYENHYKNGCKPKWWRKNSEHSNSYKLDMVFTGIGLGYSFGCTKCGESIDISNYESW